MLQLPKVIGHRGAAAYAPENTLASFREARRRGATWVETDVVLTSDGVPVLMHDDSLKRTTGIDRLVAETPRADLPTEVPTFEEAIACWGELGLGCNVEIKPSQGREAETARAVVETLRRCWPAHLPQPLLSSFKDASLAAAHAAAPEFARALLIGRLADDWRQRAEAVGQHVRGDAKPGPELGEPCRAEEGLAQDQERPPLAEDAQRAGDRAARVRNLGHASQYTSGLALPI
jgi:glycerophosphoryl diester phosphodiesterase